MSPSRTTRWIPAVTLCLLVAGAAPPPEPVDIAAAGRTRWYYIAADEVAWNYVPGDRDEVHGRAFADTAFLIQGAPRPVATTYRKAVYREYTDSTFRTLKPQGPQWEHLGFVGPVLRGEVGDTIRVVFRNNGNRPYSMHPHGVFYNKDSEGAPYNDGTAGADKRDDGVPPQGTHVYVWPVPERAGPTAGEGSSVMWMYHSHVDETKDVNTGLLGVMVVTRRGLARPDGSPNDVDREFVAVFAQTHEEDSWLAPANIPDGFNLRTLRPNPSQVQNFYPYFVTFTVNGFAHGSMPLAAMTMRRGERVRWYIMASTNDFDFHAVHWHGNTVTANHMRTDVVNIGMMQMVTADMAPDNPGTWLLHCHVTFHNAAGMATRYAVVDR
ncbi:MAG: multicopper oxidase domain-containing protein [Gemmatimonadales bacterium]